MFTIDTLVQPDTLEESYKILTNRRNNIVLGGCAFLRMGNQRIGTAIDLSRLNLGSITVTSDYIEIGALATFRQLETHYALQTYFGGIIPQAVANIIGVQFRNIVTVGASVFSKYGFSDLITALLALNTEVELYNGGRMPLETFLQQPYRRDILTKIWIKKDGRRAAYQSLRNSASDYPIVNAAVSVFNNEWRIVVGARPLTAAVAHKAAAVLTQGTADFATIGQAAAMAAQELTFGTNMRGSASYRRSMASVLIKKAAGEVLQCR